MKKTLALGTGSFPEMILNNRYYVDKTAAIKPLMLSEKSVQVITRPRRFGKTLFMDTLRHFLEVNASEPGSKVQQERLFTGLKIRESRAFCDEFMGQFPVLMVSLRKVKGLSFDSAMSALAETIQPIAESYLDLLASPRLTEDDKIYLRHCQSRDYLLDPKNRANLRVFLSKMTSILARHYERQMVLLIDEYDVPLQKAAKAGYYTEMLDFMQKFFFCLKAKEGLRIKGRSAIGKVVMTGCLRLNKVGIFTDVNNVAVSTVCMQGGALATAIGFTAEEVSELLTYCELDDNRETVKRWYGGYRFGTAEIYCPSDVIHYGMDILDEGVDRETFQLQNYWAETSSNDAIDEFLGFLPQDDADKMQTLLDGGVIEFEVNEQISFDDFARHEPDDFWTLLLFTGYLTVVNLDGDKVQVSIPNKEIKEALASRVSEKFSKQNPAFVRRGEALVTAALEGNAEGMQNVIASILDGYVYVRNTAERGAAENYYHRFLTNLLSGTGAKGLRSNIESGDGRADLVFTSGVGPSRIGVVIEIRQCAEPQDMCDAAAAALKEIHEKRYAASLERLGCGKVCTYGIAFWRRNCIVEGGVVSLRKSEAGGLAGREI